MSSDAASTTPAVIPSPTLAPQIAEPWPRSAGVRAPWARIASPHARIAAPPTPSSTRAPTKSALPVATAQSSEPTPVATSPTTYVRRRPSASPTAPEASRAAASPTLIELRIQARAPLPDPRSAAVCGIVAIGVT